MRVRIADVLHHTANQFEIIGQQSIVHVFADEVTKDATEVFVAGRGEEAS